jgi:hypothetical protein
LSYSVAGSDVKVGGIVVEQQNLDLTLVIDYSVEGSHSVVESQTAPSAYKTEKSSRNGEA